MEQDMKYDITNSEYRIVRVPEIFSYLLPQPANMEYGQFKSGHNVRLSPIYSSLPSYQDKPQTIVQVAGYMIVLGHVGKGPIEGCWYAGNPKDASKFYESLVNLIHKGGKIKPFSESGEFDTSANDYAVKDADCCVIYEDDEGT